VSTRAHKQPGTGVTCQQPRQSAQPVNLSKPAGVGQRAIHQQELGTLTFAADGEDTIMSWDWQVRPKGWLRVLGPLSGPLGSRMERRIWTGLKHQLEGGANDHPA
jgi:hypothetical protein